MKPEAQRIAIAEACGWMHRLATHESPVRRGGMRLPNLFGDSIEAWWHETDEKNGGVYSSPPKYTTDLNAMHEAEKYFDGKPVDLRSLWVDNLAVCGDWPQTKNAMELKFEVSYATQRLTAAQRAKAFIRTIGKWVADDHPTRQ